MGPFCRLKGYILFRSQQVVLALGLVAVALAVRFALDPLLHDRLPYALFLVAAILAAWKLGVAEAALITLLGWFVANWFFDAPRHALSLHGPQEWLGSTCYWFIGGAVLLFAKAARSAQLRELSASVELRRREAAAASYRHIFVQAPVGLAELEPASGSFLQVNPRVCELTGYTEEEMLRKRLLELACPVEGPSDWTAVSRRLAGAQAGVEMELKLMHKNGSTVRVALRTAPRNGDENPAAPLVCVLRDLTASPLTELAGSH